MHKYLKKLKKIIRDKKDESNQTDYAAIGDSLFFKNKRVFHTRHFAFVANYVNWQSSVEPADPVTTGFLFSGIADNSDFQTTCKNMGMGIRGFAEFSDHHWYTQKDLIEIYEKYKESRADALVTTQKDYIKIKELISDLFPLVPLIVIGIKIKFKTEHKDKFENLIKTKFNTYLTNK